MEADSTTTDDAEGEKINTSVQAVPFVDLLYFETSTGTQHLVNARDAYRARPYSTEDDTYEVSSMCGNATIDVPVDADLHAVEGLTHFADVIDPETLNDDFSLMNNPQVILDNLCASCRASWQKTFEETNEYQTVRYGLNGEWES